MIINIVTWCVIVFVLGGLLAFYVIEAYINLFEAEKLRKKIVSLPEYNPTWIMMAQIQNPFKWWHFYRKEVFSFCLVIRIKNLNVKTCFPQSFRQYLLSKQHWFVRPPKNESEAKIRQFLMASERMCSKKIVELMPARLKFLRKIEFVCACLIFIGAGMCHFI